MSVDHYENFPVASWLCPPALRPPIVAIYRFARTADDIADEGDVPAPERRALLAAYRQQLSATLHGEPPAPRWRAVFEPLAMQARAHRLPPEPLHDLLSAFEIDTGNPDYGDREALLGYCRLSANPIGRLLLHLYGIDDDAARRESDAVCSALQLINFWQDLSVDGPRGRHYVPRVDRERHGVTLDDLHARRDSAAARALVRELCDWAVALMHQGAPLVHRVPGRAGWELRGVVQGGLRVAEKIAAMDHAALTRRPRLHAGDVVPIAWRALLMRRRRPSATARAGA